MYEMPSLEGATSCHIDEAMVAGDEPVTFDTTAGAAIVES
jgi:hypothetical protein